MVAADALAAREVGDGPRDAQQPVVATCREPALVHRTRNEALRGGVERTMPAHLGHRELGVRATAAAGHSLARRDDATPHLGRALSRRGVAQLLVRDPRHVDTQVDAVQERSGDARVVAVDRVRQAGARSRRITELAARARVHRPDQREPGGIRRGRATARDRDAAFLHRLAQRVEDLRRELRQLVEEQRAGVRESILSHMVKAAAIYCRISDDRTGEQAGVGRQEADCRALAKRKGWPVAGIYTDNDVSASSYSRKARPAYQKLLEDMRGRAVDAVITWHEDRLHRRPRELEAFIDIANSSDVQLATVTGEIDLGTPEGRLRARMLGNVGAYESEHKAVRIRRKHQEIAAQGKDHGGGPRPFGYEDDRQRVREREAKHLRDAATRILAGASLRSLVTEWNRKGIKTSGGRDWYTSAMHRLLTSARIAGWREHEGKMIAKATWPPIITRRQNDRLRLLLNDPARRKNEGARRYLLTGIAYCSLCGHRLVARPRADKRRSYVCASGANFNGCGKIRVLAEPFEELIAAELPAAIDADAFGKAMHEARRPATAASQVNAIETKLADLATDFAHDRITRREWLTAREVLDKRLEAATGNMTRQQQHVGLLPYLSKPDALAKAWPALGIERQRAIVMALVERVVVAPVAVRGRNKFEPERVSVEWRF